MLFFWPLIGHITLFWPLIGWEGQGITCGQAVSTMEQFSASFHVSEVNNAAHISWFNWLNNPQPAAQAEIEKLSLPVNI